jgi:hypothetical protein
VYGKPFEELDVYLQGLLARRNRAEDATSDAFSVFNILQENVIRARLPNARAVNNPFREQEITSLILNETLKLVA